MPWLKKGRTLVSDLTNQCYRVQTHRIAQGGFAEIYRGVELDDHRDPGDSVAIKVLVNAQSWHGEAYFGRLLEDEDRVVRLRDAWQLADGTGKARQVKYILVFDWIHDGTVNDALADGEAWPEDHVVEQLVNLLRVLALIHRRAICHGDITPRNVFVRDRELLLGDLGIAKQSLYGRYQWLEGAAPDAFCPEDADPYWSPSEDVYQLGLIALSLLAGEVMTTYEVTFATLKALKAGDHLKGWIRDCVAPLGERFVDAIEALDSLVQARIEPARAPRSLKDQHVVFTGKLDTQRDIASRHAKTAGAVVQKKVNGATTLVVAGQPTRLMMGQRHGTKLYDAHRRIRRGQPIAIIDEDRFAQLVRRK